MKPIFTLLALFVVFTSHAYTGSIEIKHKQDKQLFLNGLITVNEYESIKAKLQLNLPAPIGKPTEFVDTANSKRNAYYKRDILFHVGINMFATGNIGMHIKTSYRPTNRSNIEQNKWFGGIHLHVGPAVKRRFFPSVAVGIEAGRRQINFPVYGQFAMNILKSKISPSYYIGLGYISVIQLGDTWSSNVRHDGALILAGLGLNIHINRNLSINLSPEYRLIYYRTVFNFTDQFQEHSIPHPFTSNYYQHQFSLKLALTVY